MKNIGWDWEQIEHDLDAADQYLAVARKTLADRAKLIERMDSTTAGNLSTARDILTKVLTAKDRLDYVREMIERELPVKA